MLAYRFNFSKTLEAACLLLEEHRGRMDRIRLLKLLYIADRELLAETGSVLTGDRPFAMRKGPVLSHVYDLIKGQGPDEGFLTTWRDAISADGYQVVLRHKVGDDHLTKTEERKLRELCLRFRDTDDEELSELTHDFKEWLKNYDKTKPNSAFPIAWEDALDAQDKGNLIGEARLLLEDQLRMETAFAAIGG